MGQQNLSKAQETRKTPWSLDLFLDEEGFTSEPNLGKTYGHKGQPPHGSNHRPAAESQRDQRGERPWSVLEQSVYWHAQRHTICGVSRGGWSSKPSCQDGKKYVSETRGMIELQFISPYEPDLNPDEFVWQHVKTNGISKKLLKANESIKERVKADMASIKSNPKLVRSFFHAPSVAYARD